MSPSIHSVMRGRYWTTCILRIIVLVMIAWGSLQFIGTMFQVFPAWKHLDLVHFATVGWPLRWVLVAAALIALEGRLVRWLFPLPRRGCPQCNYPIAGRPLGACPECGLALD